MAVIQQNNTMNKKIYYIGILVLFFSCSNEIKQEYYDTGELFAEYSIIDNKIHGIKNEFYKNGNIYTSTIYNNGLIDGIFKEYWNNGNIKSTIEYRDGLINGIHEKYDSLGNLLYHSEKEGELTLYYLNYNINGEIIEEARSIRISVNKDTFMVNEKMKISFEVCGPLFENDSLMVTGDFLDSISTEPQYLPNIPHENGKNSFTITPSNKGVFYFTIQAVIFKDEHFYKLYLNYKKIVVI